MHGCGDPVLGQKPGEGGGKEMAGSVLSSS